MKDHPHERVETTHLLLLLLVLKTTFLKSFCKWTHEDQLSFTSFRHFLFYFSILKRGAPCLFKLFMFISLKIDSFHKMCCPTFNHYRSANLEGERSQEWEKLFILCFHCFSHSLHSVWISKPLKVKPSANKIKFVWQNAFQLNLPPPLLLHPPSPTPNHTDTYIGMQSWLPKHINFESWQLARWCSKVFDLHTCIHCGVSVCQLVCLTWDWLPSAVS